MFHISLSDNIYITFFICFTLVLLGLTITLDLAIYTLDHRQETDDERQPYLDEEGNHNYYERALIEKNKFFKRNPQVPHKEVRSLKRLLHPPKI